jgi:phosphoglycolate phosphatase-like HAD superfamily hydrolase
MNNRSSRLPRVLLIALVLALCVTSATASAADDPLPSWNDGGTKSAIVEFVRATTDAANPKFAPPEQRIAVFDNDGTLWVEQPIPGQLRFAIERVKALAADHPEWAAKDPFKSILAGDREAMAKFAIQDLEQIIAVTHSGMSVDEFQKIVTAWVAADKAPRFGRPNTELIYQPMLEVLRYFRANGYKTYIVTGGGQDFVRTFAEPVYGVPPEQVIGSAGKVKYDYDKDGNPMLVKLPEVLLIDDKAGKPEGINLFIGRRPVAAFGNSTGDQQMLEWTGGGAGARLMVLVHHDDAEREYAYGPEAKIGTFSDALMTEAKSKGWVVISMKNDWKHVFAFEQ